MLCCTLSIMGPIKVRNSEIFSLHACWVSIFCKVADETSQLSAYSSVSTRKRNSAAASTDFSATCWLGVLFKTGITIRRRLVKSRHRWICACWEIALILIMSASCNNQEEEVICFNSKRIRGLGQPEGSRFSEKT